MYETHAGMLDGAVGMHMILLTLSFALLVAGLPINLGSLINIDDKFGAGRFVAVHASSLRYGHFPYIRF